MMEDSPIRVRFAPSPTGFLHIGSARTALFNWLFARHHGGTFVLRLDDTDEQRSTKESMQEIYDSLKWLGLEWDEGATVGGSHAPYVQSERNVIYQKYVRQLLDNGNAYRCYCTPEELAEMREQARAEKRDQTYTGKCRNLTPVDCQRLEAEGRRPVVRLKIPPEPITVEDLILGDIRVEADALQDEVIVKSNGSPLYNLTSTVDDLEMGITHVIRGADHVNNMPKQVLICRGLGMKPPQFAHVPLVLNSAKGEKLSKRRHGDLVSVGKYRQDGYLPEAVINFLVRLGWSYDDKTEIFSIDGLIEKFDLGRVGKTNSVFDIQKLQWLNGHYIMDMDIAARTDAVIPFLQQEGLLLKTDLTPTRRAWLENIVESVGDRLTTLADIVAQTSYFFVDSFEYDPKAVKKWWKKDSVLEILRGLRDVMESLKTLNLEEVESAIWKYTDNNGVKRVQAMQPLRIALTGVSYGPGLFEIIALLGRDKVLHRLDRAICHVNGGA